MHPRADAPPGLETDGEANVIPLDQRTAEDREKAQGSINKDSIKDLEQEAEHPAPMPRDQQGQGSTPLPHDLEGW